METPWEFFQKGAPLPATEPAPWEAFGPAPPATPPRIPAGRRPTPADIPGYDSRPAPVDTRTQEDRTFDRLFAPLDAAASVITSGLAAPVGAAVDLAHGLYQRIRGTGARQIGAPDSLGAEVAAAGTWQPRSPEGRALVEGAGKLMEASKLPPLPVGGEATALMPVAARVRPDGLTGPVRPEMVGVTAQPGQALEHAAMTVRRTGAAGARAAGAVGSFIKALGPEPEAGAMRGGGAAVTEGAIQRQALADSFDAPLPVTEGYLTMDPAQRAWEQNNANRDTTAGRLLRGHNERTTQAVDQNFAAWVDAEEPRAAGHPELLGRAVVDPLEKLKAWFKARHRKSYEEAEAAGHMAERTDVSALVRWVEENRSSQANAPVIKTVEDELVRLGAAKKMPNGELSPTGNGLAINAAEELRKRIIRDSPQGSINSAYAPQVNALIDAATEDKGGALYRKARAQFREYADVFKDQQLIRDLVDTKANSADRRIALEQIHAKLTSPSVSNEQVRGLYKALERVGPEGLQAIKELKAATLQNLYESAFNTITRDGTAHRMLTPGGLRKAINKLDANGRLEVMVGKTSAQKLRDMGEYLELQQGLAAGTNTSKSATTGMDMLKDFFRGLGHAVSNPKTFAVTRGAVIAQEMRDTARAARAVNPARPGVTQPPATPPDISIQALLGQNPQLPPP